MVVIGLWINKRSQNEVDKTGNTCILNKGKVNNAIKVYISPAKLVPAGPIPLLVCLFYQETFALSEI